MNSTLALYERRLMSVDTQRWLGTRGVQPGWPQKKKVIAYQWKRQITQRVHCYIFWKYVCTAALWVICLFVVYLRLTCDQFLPLCGQPGWTPLGTVTNSAVIKFVGILWTHSHWHSVWRARHSDLSENSFIIVIYEKKFSSYTVQTKRSAHAHLGRLC